jgi:hypothetical protein
VLVFRRIKDPDTFIKTGNLKRNIRAGTCTGAAYCMDRQRHHIVCGQTSLHWTRTIHGLFCDPQIPRLISGNAGPNG